MTPPFWGVTQPFRAQEENKHWRTNGHIGNITPAVWGVPNASDGEGKKITNAPQMGTVATTTLGVSGVRNALELGRP